MKRFNFFKYTTLGNKVHTTYFDYWFFKHLTQGGEPVTPAVEGEGTEFTLEPTSNKKLVEVSLKGDTSQTTLTGKNLIPIGKYDANVARAINFRITLPVNTYTVSFDLDDFDLGTTTTFNVNMQLRYSDNTTYDPVILSVNSSTTLGRKSFTFTTTKVVDAAGSQPSNISIAQSNYDAGARVVLNNVQLEEGSTATTYEPYCGGIPSPNPDYPQDVNVVTGTQTLTITNGEDVQTYPITLGSTELCKIATYQDYIYKSGDKWYVKKETASVAVKDNIYWTINNNCFQGTPYTGKKSDSTCICTHFTFNPIRSGITSNLKDGEFGFNTSEIPTFKYTTITTTTDWNTWLSTNNPIVYYILATATDTEITDATLLADLNDLLSSGYLKKGTNTIQTTATGTNLPTIIYIKSN